ncbi:hypothetical protein HaLaN_14699, partial [Haematococcus lacustris]
MEAYTHVRFSPNTSYRSAHTKSYVTDCMALALRSAKGVGGHRPKYGEEVGSVPHRCNRFPIRLLPPTRMLMLSSLSDAGGRSDDCMLRNGSNLNH